MKASHPSLPPLDERFDNLLITPARVAQMLGKRSPGEVSFDESEQNNARRRLLHVEKVAIKNKQIQADKDASYLDRVNAMLHQRVFNQIQGHFSKPQTVFKDILGLDENIAPLLDILSVKSTSISRIEPHAAALPWLYEELLSVVNAPKFRRRDARGKVIPVETLRTALSFLGINNLRLLLPYIILRKALPKITDPFPEIKNRLLQYAQGTALTLRELAPANDIEPHEAYTVGIFSQLGRCAIVRLYFKYFEQVQIEMLQEAEAERETTLHAALTKLPASANYLIAIQNMYADTLNAHIVKHMHFSHLPLASTYLACVEPANESNALADLLSSAQQYTSIRMLHQSQFLDKQEIASALANIALTRAQRDHLKMVDIFQLPLIENIKGE
ncbi:HDOD domain-containing protein [Alteromonas sp. 14N.309.X.WAT.G.H12]|uniref:HDOD domain-containing protein n=1 Tax=Alteromonas sp. 14N.309.X.WAT.G.H12 TaxID=3120824 RepID=UPI002FD5281D